MWIGAHPRSTQNPVESMSVMWGCYVNYDLASVFSRKSTHKPQTPV